MSIASRTSSFFLLALATSCEYPRDAGHTMDHIAHGVMRVGVVENKPWVHIENGQVSGIEADMIRDLAGDVDAKIEWVRGPESELLHSVKERKVDVVIAGITMPSPWSKEVAQTKPFYVDTLAKKKHVVAVAPGENRWMMRVEQHLKSQTPRVAKALESIR